MPEESLSNIDTFVFSNTLESPFNSGVPSITIPVEFQDIFDNPCLNESSSIVVLFNLITPLSSLVTEIEVLLLDMSKASLKSTSPAVNSIYVAF